MRFLRPRAESEDLPGGGPAALPPGADWHGQALRGIPMLWLRIDPALRVVEASPAAVEFFERPAVPNTLINFTRTPDIEERASEVLAGLSGPWEVSAPNFRATLRQFGVRLDDGGAFLHFVDVTETTRLETVRAEFVANLAHELRTPVASLSLAAQTLARGLSPDAAATFGARIAEETRYVESLLRTVTELAQLEGEVKLQRSQFSLHDVAGDSWRRVVDRLGPAEMRNEIPEDAWVSADRGRIAEVLQNLLENAHHYSPEGRPVMVGADVSAAETVVWVLDEGRGIPPKEIPRVFERFYKVDRARTRRGGSGLGLAISKHLVSAHGGRIWAEGAEPNGTRVSFSIPAETAPQGRDDPASFA